MHVMPVSARAIGPSSPQRQNGCPAESSSQPGRRCAQRGSVERDHVAIHEEGDRRLGQPPGAQIVGNCETVCGSEGRAHHLPHGGKR
jgi:hypothetical protein